MTIDAGSIMTQPVVAIRPDATVAEVANLLVTKGISAVPVCDDAGRLLGMISEGDLLRPFGLAHALRRAWWLEILARDGEWVPELVEYLRSKPQTARDLMSQSVVSISEHTTLGELADLLLRHRIKRVPVVRDGKVVGVVSRADLVRALAANPEALVDAEWRPSLAGENAPAPYLPPLRAVAFGSQHNRAAATRRTVPHPETSRPV